jgi:hypothetical protein
VGMYHDGLKIKSIIPEWTFSRRLSRRGYALLERTALRPVTHCEIGGATKLIGRSLDVT